MMWLGLQHTWEKQNVRGKRGNRVRMDEEKKIKYFSKDREES